MVHQPNDGLLSFSSSWSEKVVATSTQLREDVGVVLMVTTSGMYEEPEGSVRVEVCAMIWAERLAGGRRSTKMIMRPHGKSHMRRRECRSTHLQLERAAPEELRCIFDSSQLPSGRRDLGSSMIAPCRLRVTRVPGLVSVRYAPFPICVHFYVFLWNVIMVVRTRFQVLKISH